MAGYSEVAQFFAACQKKSCTSCVMSVIYQKKPHYDDFTETHYTATILMAVSFNAIHKKCKESYSKTLEDICNRYRSTPEMYKNTIFRPYSYQPVGNRESWERKPTKHSGNQNYDAEKSGKILRSKVELKSLQHYNSSPLCAIAFSGLVLSLSPTGGRSWVIRPADWGAGRGFLPQTGFIGQYERL